LVRVFSLDFFWNFWQHFSNRFDITVVVSEMGPVRTNTQNDKSIIHLYAVFFPLKFGEVGNCMSHTTSRQSLELFEKYTMRDKKWWYYFTWQ
jgi:hypothetical protein